MSAIINGQIYDHDDCELTVIVGSVQKVFPFLSFSDSAPRESEAFHGHQRRPVARTTGRVDPQWEATFLKEIADDFLQFVASANGAIYGGTFHMSLRYGTGTKPKQVDKFIECSLDDVKGDVKDGVQGIEVTLPGKCNDMSLNGLRLFPASTT